MQRFINLINNHLARTRGCPGNNRDDEYAKTVLND